MIVVTSLSPQHTNASLQAEAIKSWQPFGVCYSLNTASEIEKIEKLYSDIVFIKTNKTVESLMDKPLVSINAILDFANVMEEDLLLINSDIILSGLPELKQDGITILSRCDYTNSFEDCRKFEAGFDVFHIPHNFLNIFPPCIYALGAAWFDYWIPFRVILNNIPLYYSQEKYAFHKRHETQYSIDEWYRVGKFFRWEFRLNEELNIEQIATDALANIKSRLRKI